MKDFFKSYNDEVFKPSLKWMKKHWKGLAILSVATYGVEVIWLNHKVNKIMEECSGNEVEED